MVITLRQSRRDASLLMELLVAMALLTGALLPLAYSMASEKRLARSAYQRAVAMEIVDAEMEILAAGEWRALKPGITEYSINAPAVTNLPPGRFLLSLETNRLSLEWQPAVKMRSVVVREITLR